MGAKMEIFVSTFWSWLLMNCFRQLQQRGPGYAVLLWDLASGRTFRSSAAPHICIEVKLTTLMWSAQRTNLFKRVSGVQGCLQCLAMFYNDRQTNNLKAHYLGQSGGRRYLQLTGTKPIVWWTWLLYFTSVNVTEFQQQNGTHSLLL